MRMCGYQCQHLIFQQFQMHQYNEKVLNQARKIRGYLQKCSSGLLSIWQKRYFIILEQRLNYYADETLQESKKKIQIKEINYIKVVDRQEFHLVTKKRIYQLRAENQETRDLWVASLNILINYESWLNYNQKNPKLADKNVVSRAVSRSKKSESSSPSPPSLSKESSIKSSRLQIMDQPAVDVMFARIGLNKLSQIWSQEDIRNKIMLLKQTKGFYFIISCKTFLKSYEDEDFLKEGLVAPLLFNTLYFYDFGLNDLATISRCNQIQRVEEQGKKLMIQMATKRLQIVLDFKKTEVIDVLQIVNKIKHSIQIAKEYYNSSNIKIKRNIDKTFYKFDNKQSAISQIVKREIQKIGSEAKDNGSKHDFRKNIQGMKKSLRQIIDCCDAVGKSRLQFKEKFVKDFNQQSYQYIQKVWNNSQKTFTKNQQKKILGAVYELWKVSKQTKLFEFVIALQCKLIQKYKEQIINKINSCFSLSESQIIDEVNIDIKSENEIIQKAGTIFYSNKIYKQFHIDIRLVLHQLPQMLVDEKVLEEYVFFIRSVFVYISQQTFKCVDKWKETKLLLGTCNEIQFIKNSLFQQMQLKLTKCYPNFSKFIKQKLISQIDSQMSNTQILLMKKMFVSTFSTIDRALLTKQFTQLSASQICFQIVQKLKAFTKINKYVKRNIFQASFQEICYFYYSNLIKFNRENAQKQYSADFYIKKISEDIKSIGDHFQKFIHHQKIYAHLKDLSLLKQFIQTDLSQVKKVCQSLKKQFGNSFTEGALVNLLSLRDMNEEMRQNLALEYFQIVKNSADTPEQISITSSNRESFLQNWNNARSRKSTLTLSLNEFYENQHTIYSNKYSCSVWKQGYLLKKKIQKNINSPQIKAFYKICHSKIQQYQSQSNHQATGVYQLQMVRNCYFHPDKNYIFFLDMKQFKLQFKAETSDQARQWVKNIYQQMSALSVLNDGPEKERTSSNNILQTQKDGKDPSTMESFSKFTKEKSLDKSYSSSPMALKKKVEQPPKRKKEESDRIVRSMKEIAQEKQRIDDNCFKCSKGLFF